MEELALQVLVIVAAAGACYGAIRGDIRHLIAGVAQAQKTADRAHARIDSLLGTAR